MPVPAPGPRPRWKRWAPLALLLVIMAAGAALRLGYFLNGDPFVDEWVTMLAARSIVERGLPILPSGTFYGHGMLFSYLDALFLETLGWTPLVAQLPSLIAGLLAIPLTYWAGRQLFAAADTSPGQEEPATGWWRAEAIGLLSAAVLALDPIAILWAGRARGYTVQQVFVLLAMVWFYRRHYWLFALAFVGAVFSHAEAALLLPGFAVGLMLLEGRSIVRQPRAWLAMGISGVAVIARYQVHRLISTEPGRQVAEVATRPAFEPSVNIVAGFEPLLPYFTEPYRLAITVLFLAGLAFAVRAWQQRRESGYLLLYPLCLLTLASMLTIVGQTWKDPRYLYMLLPAMFMLAAATAVDLWRLLANRFATSTWLKSVLAGGLVLALLIPPVPEALDITGKLEEGYGPTLAYVREQWQPGDQVAGWAVPAIAIELGQVDYFALQIRHEEFIMEKDGVWVDRWAGAPLMNSVEQLQAALDQPGRLWFLTDEFRFRSRYTPEFAQAIWDRMEPVFRYHYAIAFLERPPSQPDYQRDVQTSFEDGLDLVAYGLEPARLQPGDTLTVTLDWQARDWVGAAYTTFVHLLDPTGQRVDQADGPPFDGLHPTDHWLPGERLHDRRHLTVPVDASPGRYQLVVGWYNSLTQDRLPLVGGGDSLSLASIPLGPIEVEEPGIPVRVPLEGQVELAGFDLWREAGGQWVSVPMAESLIPGDRLNVRLVWRVLTEMDHDYTTFVHLEGPGGTIWGQHDGPPAGGSYPTSHWRPGDLVADEHEFTVSTEAEGPAQLLAGMYRLETMEGLGQPVLLREVDVGAISGSEATP